LGTTTIIVGAAGAASETATADGAPPSGVAVLSWSALAAVMTDKRHELLRHLRRRPAPSVRALARELGRDYKRVHDDVARLAEVGLVRRDGDLLRTDIDEIRAVITMRP
jgi:predicted transcriptional regulator